MTQRVLILGINGFIGSHLTSRILSDTDWEVYGMDMTTHKIAEWLNHPRLKFYEGDITLQRDWVEYLVKKCDVVLPLVAIATPSTYVNDPLRVFELDFEANITIIRHCVKYHKRVVFPSTSEVYGMCPDQEFDEENSVLVTGPINKPRWIYSTCKQLLDRVIAGYGDKNDLPYTLFRPFNWIGPKLDDVLNPNAGGSRVITQFIGNILRGQDIHLVNGGLQRRSFIDIDDAIGALLKIIANEENCALGRIFNIGNPKNDVSIKELAELLLQQIANYPAYAAAAAKTQLITTPAEKYYGQGYQDVGARVPSIKNAKHYLNWQPTTDLPTAIRKTLDFYL